MLTLQLLAYIGYSTLRDNNVKTSIQITHYKEANVKGRIFLRSLLNPSLIIRISITKKLMCQDFSNIKYFTNATVPFHSICVHVICQDISWSFVNLLCSYPYMSKNFFAYGEIGSSTNTFKSELCDDNLQSLQPSSRRQYMMKDIRTLYYALPKLAKSSEDPKTFPVL